MSKNNGQDMAKNISTRGRDIHYWKGRLYRATYRHCGEIRLTKSWCVRLQHAAHRELFNLDTANKTTAASRAKERYEFLRAHGWEATRKKFKHDEERSLVETRKNALTVGQYIGLVEEIAADLGARTLHNYSSSLRRLVAEIRRKPFDPKNSNRWRKAVDHVPLEKISSTAIEKWKASRLRRCEGNPQKEDRAKITVNSILRQCRALFGRRFVPKLIEAGIPIPEPVPFSNVSLFKEDTSAKFQQQIDPETLAKAAVDELHFQHGVGLCDESETRSQLFLAFLLCFAAGLRKGEADTIEWDAIEFDDNQIRIRQTEFFRPKTRASARPVALDKETIQFLRLYRDTFPEDQFVLRSELPPKPASSYAYYRCAETWTSLGDWLTRQGIDDQKPIHYCRKAITAFVAKTHGIYAAQRHARHTSPAVTARFYSDSEDAIPPGIGGFFAAD